MKSIYMTGFMGAGKSTVSRLLAEEMGLAHHDTDEEIVNAAGKSINRIFEEDGEIVFRKLESEILHVLPKENAVIATGGGIIVSEENRIFMRRNGIVIFLYASIEEILERLKEDTTRPLLQGDNKEKAASLYEMRLPLYRETADICAETGGKQAEEIASDIKHCLKGAGLGHTC
ncbi:shikimate kinase [Mesobacillus zeae]|uniref:Shikimate kinase n=1 Tax=Mesobacillus zeae TaxID=1917180 RepID=A0A398B4W6_9BACI|nr:shikimate kinase [Mesobacillus zeae]RID83868.1 shikimate kinase [Mesobacillus zeae]